MTNLPSNVSDDVKRLNPELFSTVKTITFRTGVTLEEKMVLMLDALGYEYQREYKFHPDRRWRFDFAIIERQIAIECEGGVWSGGRHTRGGGFIADCDKYNEATLAGWQVFRFTSEHLSDGRAWDMLRRLNQCQQI